MPRHLEQACKLTVVPRRYDQEELRPAVAKVGVMVKDVARQLGKTV